MHEYSTNPEFYKFFEYEPFKTIEETNEYLEKLIKRSSLETGHYWFIRLKRLNKVIGTFGLADIDYRKGSTEIGYGLSPDYWGQGLFKEVLITVLEYLFVDLQFHRVWAKTQSNNIPSVRALEKVGFTKEGTMRDFYLSIKGKRYNATLLSILRNEFYRSSNDKSR
jgi:ribosomal-protein-alanine N-acetyltransferase